MTWVVDTGPLSHFAKAGWLGVLKMLAPEHRIVIPDVVDAELRREAAHRSCPPCVRAQDWIEVRTIDSDAELSAFGRYHGLLVGDNGRNVGECGVLALAEVHHWTAVVDDQEACRAARRAGSVEVRRTLGLLCDAVRQGLLTRTMISAVADDLARSKYRVPFEPGGFIWWAEEKGLL